MADKLRPVAPLTARFAAGEVLEPTKLDGMSLQTTRAFSILEYALGDLWNSGGDAFLLNAGLTTFATMVPNITRYLGMSYLLNPYLDYLPEITEYTHNFLDQVNNAPLDMDGNPSPPYEAQLSLPPSPYVPVTYTFSGSGAPSAPPKTYKNQVIATGDWWIDIATGQCFFYDRIDLDWKVTYIPNVYPEVYSFSPNSPTSNVIPDPRTHASYAFAGCKIAYANNTDNTEGYIIFLPPRGPIADICRPVKYPQNPYSSPNTTDNVSSTPGSLPVKYWQSSSVAATTGTYGEHYRYHLPYMITNNWSASSVLPGGLLYLFDGSQTGTILQGIQLTAENSPSPRSYVLIASGTALDTWVNGCMATAYASCGGTAALTQIANHNSTYYPSTGLKVICIGNSLSDSVSGLVNALVTHAHGSITDSLIDHRKLANLYSPDGDMIYTSNPPLPPSRGKTDDHPQYINRQIGGPTDAFPFSRDDYNGGMFTDLFFLSKDSLTDYQNVDRNSYGIRFGHFTNGPYIYYDAFYGISSMWHVFCVRHQTDGTVLGLNAYSGLTEIGAYNPGGEASLRVSLGSANVLSLTAETNSCRIVQEAPYITIEDLAQDEGSAIDGRLKVARIVAGNHTDTTYTNAVGPVRRIGLSPADFTVIQQTSSSNCTPLPAENLATRTVSDYDQAGSKPNCKQAISLVLEQSGVFTPVVAYGFINLPFAQYKIVDVKFAFKASWEFDLAGEEAYVVLGHMKTSDNSIPYYPRGGRNYTVDFIHLTPTPFTSGHINTWQTNNGSLYSLPVPGTIDLHVDNRVSWDGWGVAVDPVQPYVQFCLTKYSYLYYLEIANVSVYYSILEW